MAPPNWQDTRSSAKCGHSIGRARHAPFSRNNKHYYNYVLTIIMYWLSSVVYTVYWHWLMLCTLNCILFQHCFNLVPSPKSFDLCTEIWPLMICTEIWSLIFILKFDFWYLFWDLTVDLWTEIWHLISVLLQVIQEVIVKRMWMSASVWVLHVLPGPPVRTYLDLICVLVLLALEETPVIWWATIYLYYVNYSSSVA